jgi:hypothetical protein
MTPKPFQQPNRISALARRDEDEGQIRRGPSPVLRGPETVRRIDPRLQRVARPARCAPTQMHRRRKAPFGDTPVTGGAA